MNKKISINILTIIIIIILFFVDIKKMLMLIPNMSIFLKNIKFLNVVITKYFFIVLFVIIVSLLMFYKKSINITIPKISFAGIEINLKNVEKIVWSNITNYLRTKRTIFKINYEYDNFDDVLESYHQVYEFLRLQISYYQNFEKSNCDTTYKHLEGMIKELNIFLTRNQANYRRWYKIKNNDNFMFLTDLQKSYPKYDELKKEFNEFNKKMEKYAKYFKINTSEWI